MDILYKVNELIESQLTNWDLAAINFKGLNLVKTRSLILSGGSEVKIQFNPERIRSSAAKVDARSIQERPCFLCEQNRPEQQRGVDFEDYTILVNPFPIFNKHLTIPHKKHTLQLIQPYFKSMLDLAYELPEYTLFYNGPKCGASAPDHFHFQAGNKGFMPIEEDFKSGRFAKLSGLSNDVAIYTWKNYNRGVITLMSSESAAIVSLFNELYDLLVQSQKDEVEPMLNVLSYFEEGEYVVHVFPRILHRPASYFKEGTEQILISPASVDMGGVFITPRQEDYEKLTANDVEEILNQVCLDSQKCEELIQTLIEKSIQK
ncbi:DUF4922 domain-containing protein [Carboxylicivirga caseinilyticus]|uniref:DUF4922 domain-containing protein n=1 Tax=Carboxylicivirga caseinilyticus TaxID=3417572 RepID=UPI003D34D210|nr:DUF4922 domain-containing protein [Marinilabiliaceae bacterium A049]